MTTLAMAFSSRIPEGLSLRQQSEEYWVECSRSADAKEVRESLLVQHFGYLPEDVALLVLETGFTITDKRTPKVEATKKQISGWRRDGQGRVPIKMSAYWIDTIRNFRLERVRKLLSEAAASIGDPVMRAKWSEMMLRVLTESGVDRGTTFISLMNAMNGSGLPRQQFVSAFESLQRSAVGSNPYIELGLANLALEDAMTLIGPGYVELARARVAEAMRKLAAVEIRADGRGGSFTRADAEVINRQAARIYAALGDEDAANRREWIARFMGMSAEERAEYEEGDMVYVVPPGVKSVSAPNKTSRDLTKLDEEWTERQRMEQQINNIGAQTLPNFPNDDKLFNQGTESITIDGVVLRKKRGTGRGYQPRYRVSTVTVPLRNPTQVTNMKGGMAPIELFNIVGKYVAANRRTQELAAYLTRRDELRRRLRNQNFRTIPPRPAKLKALIDELVARDASTTDARAKQELQSAISTLRALLEESRAAWPGQ